MTLRNYFRYYFVCDLVMVIVIAALVYVQATFLADHVNEDSTPTAIRHLPAKTNTLAQGG